MSDDANMWTTKPKAAPSGRPTDAAAPPSAGGSQHATSRRNPRPLPPDQRTRRTPYSKAVGSLLPKLTAKAFEKYGFHSAEIMMSWAMIVGDDLARICLPEKIKWPRQTAQTGSEPDIKPGNKATRGAGQGATLILRVAACHALDVEYRSAEIADRINRYFGYLAIDRVKVLQAPLTTSEGAQNSPSQHPLTQPTPAPVAAPLDGIDAPDDVRAQLEELWRCIQAGRQAGPSRG